MQLIPIKYQVDDKGLITAERNVKNLDKSTDKLREDTEKYRKEVKKTGDQGEKSFGTLKKAIGAVVTIALLKQLASVSFELLKISEGARGIEKAFENLNRPTLLDQLRDAVKGTVDDLTLMQSAVKAQNFKIPLENLAGFFKFATIRAQETGESVNFLVESIINGIGRKSSLVLDNLGISASELQAEIKKTGDFAKAAGNIINRSMGPGSQVDETITVTARFAAAWENVKVAIADFLNSEAASGLVNFFTNAFNATSKFLKELGGEIVGTPEEQIAGYTKRLKELLEMQKLLDPTSKNFQKDQESISMSISKLSLKINALRNGLEEEKKAKEKTTEATKKLTKSLQDVPPELPSIQDQLEKTAKMFEAAFGVAPEEFIEKKMKESLENGLKALDNFQVQSTDKTRKWKKDNEQIYSALFDESLNTAFSFFHQLNQAREVDFQSLQDQRERELDLAGDNEAAREQIEKRFDEKRKVLEREQAERRKKQTIQGILITSLENAVRALGTPPVPNFALAGITAAFGATNAALASSIPAFKDGGINIKGPGTGTSDSIPAMISRGESVITARATKKSEKILEAINSGKLNDATYAMLMGKSSGKGGILGFDDTKIVDELRKNRPPDYVRQGNDLYKVRKVGENTRQKVRQKVLG